MSITAPTTDPAESTEWLARPRPTRFDGGARIAWLTGALGPSRCAPALCVPSLSRAGSDTTTDHDPVHEAHRRPTT